LYTSQDLGFLLLSPTRKGYTFSSIQNRIKVLRINMGRKQKLPDEKMEPVPVRLAPETIAWLTEQIDTQDVTLSALVRRYVILGIETETQSPGLSSARQFLGIYNKLPAKWREMLWTFIQFLYTQTITSELERHDEPGTSPIRPRRRKSKNDVTRKGE
jgi:hypothetical protein